MGFIGGMIKVGIANRVIREARKPHNQARAKELFGRVTGKGGGSGTGRGPAPRR